MMKCNECQKTFSISDIKKVQHKTIYSWSGWELQEECPFCGAMDIEHTETDQPKEERKSKRKTYLGRNKEIYNDDSSRTYYDDEKRYDECGNCINQWQEVK